MTLKSEECIERARKAEESARDCVCESSREAFEGIAMRWRSLANDYRYLEGSGSIPSQGETVPQSPAAQAM